ncbi:MAG: hypothetical protein EXR72_10740 [Myxococcales bacterium]|nr:hypothetical protein [Myxococcales bacterium]
MINQRKFGDGHRWGKWTFRADSATLVHDLQPTDEDQFCPFELAGWDGSNYIAAEIAFVAGQDWATPEDVGWLVLAIADLIDLPRHRQESLL